MTNEQKRMMAELVLAHLSGSTSFLDASSTVRALAFVWEAAHKTIITTGVETALLFSRKKEVSVILPGGELGHLSGSVNGAMTLRQLESFHADILLCSCGSFSLRGEISETTVEQAEQKAVMLRRAKKRFYWPIAASWGAFAPLNMLASPHLMCW